MDDVLAEVARLRAHLAAIEARFGLAPAGTEPPPQKEQDMKRLTVIEDGLTQAERTASTEMNAFIRKAAGRGVAEAPTFNLTPRQQAERDASAQVSARIRAAAGAGTVVLADPAPDPDAARRDAERETARAFNAQIRRAAGRVPASDAISQKEPHDVE